MNEAPLATWMSANSLSGICCPAGRGHQDIADFLGVVPVLALEADDEIKLLFSLHHLGGHVPADGGRESSH